MRWQYFFVKNEQWDYVPNDRNRYFLGRYLFHVDLHSGKHFRTFLQLQSSIADSKIKTRAVNQNPLDLHQVFMDIFWRYSKNDGMYVPNAVLIYPGNHTTRHYIGQQFATDFVYVPQP